MGIIGLLEKQDSEKILSDKSESNIPLSPQDRKKTDAWFSYVFIFCVAVVVSLIIYTLAHSNINRYNGYDDCGNVCGQKNVKYEQWNCSGIDMTSKPLYYYHSGCVTEGDYYKKTDRPWYQQMNISNGFKRLAVPISLVTLIPFALSIMVALSFHYATAFTAVVVLIICLVVFPISAGFFWVFMNRPYAGLAIIYILVSTVIFCISIPTINKIRQIIELLQEASIAVFASRKVIFNTCMASILTFTITAIYVIINFVMLSSGVLVQGRSDSLRYIPDNFMFATFFLCPIIVFWTVQYINGVAYLSSSAAIANRHFSRNHHDLVGTATVKYHSGTLLVVALLSPIMITLRGAFVLLGQITAFSGFVHFCLRYLDAFSFMDVSVITAMYGTSFLQSGKKAVELSKSSFGSSEIMRYNADFLLVFSQVFIIVLSSLLAYTCYGNVLVYFILYPVLYISTELVLGPIKVALHTIFFCVCHDNFVKQGTDQIHNISKKEYLNTSNKLFLKKIKAKPVSSNPPHF